MVPGNRISPHPPPAPPPSLYTPSAQDLYRRGNHGKTHAQSSQKPQRSSDLFDCIGGSGAVFVTNGQPSGSAASAYQLGSFTPGYEVVNEVKAKPPPRSAKTKFAPPKLIPCF